MQNSSPPPSFIWAIDKKIHDLVSEIKPKKHTNCFLDNKIKRNDLSKANMICEKRKYKQQYLRILRKWSKCKRKFSNGYF